MNCTFCGAENNEGAERCTSCGAPLMAPDHNDQQTNAYQQPYEQGNPQPDSQAYGQQPYNAPPEYPQQPPYGQQSYGQPPYQQSPPYGQPYPQQPYYPQPISSSNRWIAFLLCFLVGVLGIHRFYVGKVGTGILYIFTGGLCGIGWLVDLIMIACGSFTDSAGLPLKQ